MLSAARNNNARMQGSYFTRASTWRPAVYGLGSRRFRRPRGTFGGGSRAHYPAAAATGAPCQSEGPLIMTAIVRQIECHDWPPSRPVMAAAAGVLYGAIARPVALSARLWQRVRERRALAARLMRPAVHLRRFAASIDPAAARFIGRPAGRPLPAAPAKAAEINAGRPAGQSNDHQ